jgi:hypothetical protein
MSALPVTWPNQVNTGGVKRWLALVAGFEENYIRILKSAASARMIVVCRHRRALGAPNQGIATSSLGKWTSIDNKELIRL